MAPARNWPCPPILNTPVAKPSATPVPARMSGVAETRVSEIGVKALVQPLPVDTACHRFEGLKTEPQNSAP